MSLGIYSFYFTGNCVSESGCRNLMLMLCLTVISSTLHSESFSSARKTFYLLFRMKLQLTHIISSLKLLESINPCVGRANTCLYFGKCNQFSGIFRAAHVQLDAPSCCCWIRVLGCPCPLSAVQCGPPSPAVSAGMKRCDAPHWVDPLTAFAFSTSTLQKMVTGG